MSTVWERKRESKVRQGQKGFGRLIGLRTDRRHSWGAKKETGALCCHQDISYIIVTLDRPGYFVPKCPLLSLCADICCVITVPSLSRIQIQKKKSPFAAVVFFSSNWGNLRQTRCILSCYFKLWPQTSSAWSPHRTRGMIMIMENSPR